MLPPRNTSRISSLTRALRPPSIHANSALRRAFTHTTHTNHHLLSPSQTRPQLPFLSNTTRPTLPPWPTHLRNHFARLISTESRDYYRRRISRGLRIGLTFYAILVMFQVIRLGMYQEGIEHGWPTPEEWGWKSRWCLRSAKALMHPEEVGRLMTDWPMVAGYFRELLGILEDPSREEGKGVLLRVVEGDERVGFDVEGKSEPWRRGYFEALMGAAKAAENLDGWVTDWKQRISAPAEYMVGPSNPRPKPMPASVKRVPREEDSEAASASPEMFYVKILTTRGFHAGQKVDAALAYADWLDYKGLTGTAGDVYRWAMDLAVEGSDVDARRVVDTRSGVLKNKTGEPTPSENILRVSTALAVHHAKTGDLPTALSIFTSVLKTQRSLPAPSDGQAISSIPTVPKPDNPITSLYISLRNMFVPAEYPPPPPTGNAPATRIPSTPCTEAALMTYIGEIIYASSSKETGLAWTRDAVDVAESTILEFPTSSSTTTSNTGLTENANHRCAECLKVGMSNWRLMVSQFLHAAESNELSAFEAAEQSQQSRFSWVPGVGSGTMKKAQKLANERKRWEAEMMILDERVRRLSPIFEAEMGLSGVGPVKGLFV